MKIIETLNRGIYLREALWGLPLENGEGEKGAEVPEPRSGARLGPGLPLAFLLLLLVPPVPAEVRSDQGSHLPPPQPQQAVGFCSPPRSPHRLALSLTRFYLPIKLPQIAKSLICMQGTPFKDANLLSPLRT